LALAVGFAALAAGCGGSSDPGDENGNGNGNGTNNNGGGTGDTINLQGCTDCTDLVVDGIVLPLSLEIVADVSRDIDGDGQVDNAIGELAAEVLDLYNDFDAQGELDEVLNKGEVLAVVRLQTASGTLSDGDVVGQLWVAESEQCCTSDDPAQCAIEAQQSCFSGSYSFTPDTTITTNVAASGTISGGKLRLEGQTVPFRVQIFGKPTTFEIRNTVIAGEVSNGKIINGTISGAIDKSEITSTIVLELANWVNQELADPGLSSTTKDLILSVLDADGNGFITAPEITDGELLGEIFGGDVDTDGDGNKEVSVAFGYSATPATIDY
jgi:hypothetical protein